MVIIDNSEYNLYSIKKEIENYEKKLFEVHYLLFNCDNEKKLIHEFNNLNVDIVFHSAAYKHVPLVESNPIEGIENNVFSTFSICN